MGNNPSSANTTPAPTENKNQQQNSSSTENKWSNLFNSSSNAEDVRSYPRRVTEDVYDHMDPSGPKKLSTSPVADFHEMVHNGATKIFRGIPKESEDPSERPYNQHHMPSLLEQMEQKVTKQQARN